MREPLLGISAEALSACVREAYHLTVVGLDFLALGLDPSAWVYRVRAAEGPYFLKVRTSVVNEASLVVPRLLRDRGISQVIAPLRTVTGDLWIQAGGYALTLYPFVEGRTGKEQRMTDQQWIDYGDLLRRVHSTRITPDLARVLNRAPLRLPVLQKIRELDVLLGTEAFDDPARAAFAAFWQTHRRQVLTMMQRSEDLGQRLAAAAPEFVLCHADIHQANVLLDRDSQVWFTDWDDVQLAPRECDLIMAVGGIIRGLVGPREETLFWQGYGPVEVDPDALAYFRLHRALTDIGENADQVFRRPDLGKSSRRKAVANFKRLFVRGNIVSLVFA